MVEYLSPHFTLEEMTYSATAEAKGIPNTPVPLHNKILIHTCNYLLEPLRTLLNDKYKEYKGKKVKYVSINVTSGYRNERVNALVGGSSTSGHKKGECADIEAVIVYTDDKRVVLPYTELYENIKVWTRARKISVDQCIQEASYDKINKIWAYWVHVGHNNAGRTRDRGEFKKFNNGVYTLDCIIK